MYHICHNLNFGLVTKAKACKVASQEGSPGITSHALGNAKSVREWTLKLPSELPFWELESLMDFRIFRERLQGSKLNRFKRSLYHWKALRPYMFKMDSHDPFQKEGSGVKNWQFDSWPLKVKNHLDYLLCM